MTSYVNVNIENLTDYDLIYVDHGFHKSKFSDKSSWPKVIHSNEKINIRCQDNSMFYGCSGWVQYTLNGQPLFFCFANPIGKKNQIEVGDQFDIYHHMGSHYADDIEVKKYFEIDRIKDKWVVIDLYNTDGKNSNAYFKLNKILDLKQVDESNIQMNDVERSFHSLSTANYRKYYKCASKTPDLVLGFVKSHFKGLAFYKDKIIFTHTNLGVVLDGPGKYLVSDQLNRSEQGEIQFVHETEPKNWHHPCGAQACGSFMAMGNQESADGSKVSEIQIYDIRNVQINKPANLIHRIPRAGGVNGVAITKENTPDGKYIIAAGEGKVITIYKSTSSSLHDPNNQFITLSTFELYQSDKDEYKASGSGLALITQKNGDIFLVTLNDNDNGGSSKMNLYKLTGFNDEGGKNIKCEMKNSRDMPIDGVSQTVRGLQYRIAAITAFNPILGATLSGLLAKFGVAYFNSSFRWGKGLKITSEDKFEVYATDRNIFPLSVLPVVGTDKDFSLVIWDKTNT